MPYAIRLPLVLKTVVVHLLLPAALAISLGAAGGVVHADVLPPQMQDASESAAAAEAELTQGAGDRTLHPVIRLGVLTHSPPWYDGSFVDESVRWLAWKLPQFRFETDYLGTGDLMRRMEAREIDLAVAPASFFFFAQRPLMNRFVASIVSDAAVDAEESAAAAVIVRRDREDLKTLADLKGRSVSLVRDEVSPGELELKREVVRIGLDPDHFFGQELREPRLRMRAVVTDVLSGRTDAGILRACFLEELERSGLRGAYGELRVLDERKDDGLHCRHSTPAYPGWMLASTASLSQEAARAITAVLLTKPANAWGQHWTVSPNVEAYDDLFRTLRIGPYAYLREWTLARIWSEWKAAIIIVLISIVGLCVHGFVLEKLVGLRTRELKEAWKKQQETEREAREASARLESLQRAGAVGQISSIVAHEMKQPLGVIQNLSRGTLRLIEDEPETLDEVAQAVESINDEAVRAAQIIDRVRSWSQGRVNRQVLEADQGVKRAVQSFMLTNRSRGISIRTGVLQSVKVWMDPLELELIVVNLLSNVAEAARKSDHPTVMIDLQTARESLPGDVAAVVLTITDNGPALSDQTFAALGCTALQTTREGGLGLGLMIVRTLAENNVGRLTFERLAPHGLAVHVTLPVWMPEIKKADIDLREKTRAADDSKDPSSHSAL